jgi:phenylalanyl-tRNA synthetase beta chain
VKDILAAAGMQEIMTYSLVSPEQLRRVVPPDELERHPPLRVANPLSAERSVLRTSLRGSALETLARSLRVRRGETALFETAVVYLPRDGELPEERETLVGVIGGRRLDRWDQPTDEAVDFFDAKGYLEALFERLGLEPEWLPAEEYGLLPGRTAAIRVDGQQVGVVGQVHPDTAVQFDIEGDCFLFEVRLDLLTELTQRRREYRPYATTPVVAQDLAVVVDTATPAAAVLRIIRAGRYVVSAAVFDEYTGGQLPPGKRSIAVRVLFQDPTRTLTDEEVATSRRQIVAHLERELGAALR